MNRRLQRFGILASLMVAGSCVSGSAGGGPERSSGDANVLTRVEIDRGQWADAYDLVSSLRPNWLRTRGLDSFENPGHVQVYVDGIRLGDVQLLRTLSTTAMDRLEWIDPVSAAGRWGLNHAHGVIYITYSRAGALEAVPEPDSTDDSGSLP